MLCPSLKCKVLMPFLLIDSKSEYKALEPSVQVYLKVSLPVKNTRPMKLV